MTKQVDHYLSLSSPWTFLGWDRLHEIARRHGAVLSYYPVDFGIVFPATGGLPLPKRSPARQAYRMAELKRWKSFLGADDFNFEPAYFPVDSNPASLLAIAAREQGHDIGPLCRALLSAVWCDDLDISAKEVLVSVAKDCDLDGDVLFEAAGTEEVAQKLMADSERAIERQVFGAPTSVYRGELFWGQDRLDFLDRALAAG